MIIPQGNECLDWTEFVNTILVADQLAPEFQERFHLEWTVRGHHIRQSLRNDQILAKFLRSALPAYGGNGCVLYRGENLDRWSAGIIGFGWTTSEATARMFGRGLNAVSNGGVLLRTVASAESIIAGPSPHSHYLNEGEFTLEPALLRQIDVIEQYDQTENLT